MTRMSGSTMGARWLRAGIAACLAAGALVACGGGDGSESAPATPQEAVATLRMRALAAGAQAVAPEEAARQLMDFGEAQFPQYFPSRQPTQSFPPFAFRYYAQTGVYLGVVVTAGQGYEYMGVYVMGGPFGNAPQFVGPLAQFISLVELPIDVVVGSVGALPDRLADALVSILRDRGIKANVVYERSSTNPLAAMDFVMRQPALGRTVLVSDSWVVGASTVLTERDFDPRRDLQPVGLLAHSPHMLVGSSRMPEGGFAALDAWWRAGARKPSFGHERPGSASHLCALALADRIGLPVTLRRYDASVVLRLDLINADVDLSCARATDSATVRQLRLYGVTSIERSAHSLLANVETLDRSGLPGFEFTDWIGLYLHKDTPPGLVQTLREALALAVGHPYFPQRVQSLGLNPVPQALASPEGHRQWLDAEVERWRGLVRKFGTTGAN